MNVNVNLLTVPLAAGAHLVGVLAMADLFRARVWAVHFGVGPVLLRGEVRGIPLALKLFPVAGIVHFRPPGEEPGPMPPVLSGIRGVLVFLAGPAGLLALAVALLGLAPALGSFARGFPQIVAGALDPVGAGPAGLEAFGRLFSEATFPACAGVLAAKLAAFNLLPLPPLNGFQALHALAGDSREVSSLTPLAKVGLLVFALLLASYAVSLAVLVWFQA